MAITNHERIGKALDVLRGVVALEIHAQVPEGVPEHVVRIVTESGRTLKFGPASGFETL